MIGGAGYLARYLPLRPSPRGGSEPALDRPGGTREAGNAAGDTAARPDHEAPTGDASMATRQHSSDHHEDDGAPRRRVPPSAEMIARRVIRTAQRRARRTLQREAEVRNA
jgi:hypothetical protein